MKTHPSERRGRDAADKIGRKDQGDRAGGLKAGAGQVSPGPRVPCPPLAQPCVGTGPKSS